MSSRLDLLVPRPQEVAACEGELSIPSRARIRALTSPSTIASSIGKLTKELTELGHEPDVVTGLADQAGDPFAITLEIAATLFGRPQSYRLHVSARAITVLAVDAAGLFYGVGTLVQLLRLHARRGSITLPCVRIEDWPDFAHRGVMLDISRDKVPTMATLLELVDTLASWKINQLQLYIEHTFAYAGHEAIWKDASPMTATEMAELDTFCAERHIELVPNQNSFGHMQRWVRYEPYRRLAEAPDGFEHPWNPSGEPYGLCPTDPSSLAFLEDLYDQLLPNFRSRQVNVGLDETIDLGLGRSRAACEERGTERVYLEFLQKIHGICRRRGFTMQFWGDIIMNRPELIAELPPQAIALEWGYEADHPFADHTAKFAASGLSFYVCPGTSSWNTIAGRTDNAIGNLKSAAVHGKRAGAIGYLNTDWGDNGHLQPLPVSYLGFLLGAGFSWNVATSERTSPTDVAGWLDTHVFRDEASVMGRVAYDLGNAYLRAGALPHNNSALFSVLMRNEGLWSAAPDRALDGVTPDRLQESLEYIDDVVKSLPSARMARPDAALVAEEFLWAADTLRFACRIGIARFATNGKVGDLAESERLALASELGGILDRHRKNWLSRNRPGGLSDSAARLSRILSQLTHNRSEDNHS